MYKHKNKIRNSVVILGVAGAIVFGAQRFGAKTDVVGIIIDLPDKTPADIMAQLREEENNDGYFIVTPRTNEGIKLLMNASGRAIMLGANKSEAEMNTEIDTYLNTNGKATHRLRTLK